MSVEGLILSLVLLSATVLLVSLPLFRSVSGDTAHTILSQKQREHFLVYYERVLTNIRDLDEDHATGKMMTEDYNAERAQWVERGIQVLKALDDLENHSIVQDDVAVDDAIEAAIRAQREKVARQSGK